MKKLKTYENFINEEIDFRRGIAAAGLMGALSGSPAVAQTTTPTSMSTERDGVEVYKNQIEEISTIRKEKSKDEKLSTILDEIKSNINSKDSAKFIELYTKLKSFDLVDKASEVYLKIELILNKVQLDYPASSLFFLVNTFYLNDPKPIIICSDGIIPVSSRRNVLA